jgi:hypothetical protein
MRAMLFREMLYDGKLCFNTFAWGWSPFLKQCLRHMSDTNYGVLRTDSGCELRTYNWVSGYLRQPAAAVYDCYVKMNTCL